VTFEDHRLGGVLPFWGNTLNPPDLRADYPDATRSCGSNSGLVTDQPACRFLRPFGWSALAPLRQPGRPSFLSWDCPKIAPPSCCSPGSPLPEPACRLPGGLPPSGRECQFPSMVRPRGLAPPRRFTPPCRDPRLAADFRPWGSPRFRRWRALERPFRADRTRAPALPRGAFLPFEAFPPNTAADARACALAVRGRIVTAFVVTDARVHRPPFPLAVTADPISRSCLLVLDPPTRPQGFPPCPGPLRTAPFPAWPARCSRGLG
jgi:hypothetical protein